MEQNEKDYHYNLNGNYIYDGTGNMMNSGSSDNLKVRERSVLTKTFLYMFFVMLLTAASSYYTLASGLIFTIVLNDMLIWLLIAELVVVFAANYTLSKGKVIPSAILLIAYSIINGITLSTVFLAYTASSIFSIFILAALIFGGMAVFGFVTKKDLTALGTIGIMGLLGIIILGAFNLIFRSDTLSLGLAAVGLALFIGLTAYDVQRIKQLAVSDEGTSTNILAMFGALMLYLDFINIFLKLLRLFGKRN